MGEDSTKGLSNVIQIDDERIQDHPRHIVRGSVGETLNALLDADADRLVGAGRYERTLHTTAGEVPLKVPKLRKQTFETAISAASCIGTGTPSAMSPARSCAKSPSY